MSRRIFALGLTGFKQLVRSRIYINLLAANVFMVLAAFVLDRLSSGEGARMLVDLGLAFGALVTSAMAATVAIVTLTGEIENKQIHLLLARPISRFEIVVGKFSTVALLVLVSNFIIGAVLWLLGVVIHAPNPERVFGAMMFLSFEGFTVGSIAILFGVGSSSTMSATFTTLFFILGRLSLMLKWLVDSGKLADLSMLFNGVYYLVPHLYLFDLTEWAQGGPSPDAGSLLQGALSGMCYIIVLLVLATFRLEKRDIP